MAQQNNMRMRSTRIEFITQHPIRTVSINPPSDSDRESQELIIHLLLIIIKYAIHSTQSPQKYSQTISLARTLMLRS